MYGTHLLDRARDDSALLVPTVATDQTVSLSLPPRSSRGRRRVSAELVPAHAGPFGALIRYFPRAGTDPSGVELLQREVIPALP